MKLTCKVAHNVVDMYHSVFEKDINFLCSDNTLHIRLREYDHEEVITGFINKLTYILTYLIQRNIIQGESADNIIKKFVKNDSDFLRINDELKYIFNQNGLPYAGITISKNYRKIKQSVKYPLGNFKPGTCYLEDSCKFSDLLGLLTAFHISLSRFLEDDGYEIIICKDLDVKVKYKKFTNKQARKAKHKKKHLEYVPLF